MAGASGDDHRVGHGILVEIGEAVLRQQDLVNLLGEVGLDGLGVALALGQLLGAVGGLVDVDLVVHACRAGQGVIDGAELHKVEVGVVLVFDLIGEKEIIVGFVGHQVTPPL